MNEIAAKLGEVGLPATDRASSPPALGRGDRRRRPQRPHRRRLPRQGGPVGARARAARAPRRRLHARAAVRRRALRGQPVRLRRRPARRARDRASCSCASAASSATSPTPTCGCRSRTARSFGQWLDDDKTQRDLEALEASPSATSTGYWAYEHLFDEIRKRLRTGERDTWVGETPTRAEIEELLHGEQTMIDVVFSASIAEVLDDHMHDQRLKDALFGQGVIAAYGGPKDPGTASIKLMHYQGDLEGQGPVWGYVKGGMGMISFAIADAAREAGAMLAAGVPVARDPPRRGRRGSRTARSSAPARSSATPTRRSRWPARRPTSPATTARASTPGRSAAPSSSSTPRSTALPDWTAAPGETGRRRRRSTSPTASRRPRRRSRRCDARRARRRLRRDLHPDRLRPHARARRAAT